ncbi:ribonuclease P protein subunit p30 [Cataglyphis hispanica]|uniref:ribonuclease P protein subunit p30 n=1 Tax=Cataglyphis hispanica TaxID=1086592 RepID=UPI00217FD21A|nr:ribonuclease P protein subunit p30 [Cataglyphis hispanica]XP_050455687.1 ribonuclease P protein subunit p30 [Cataglyphis hispanica]
MDFKPSNGFFDLCINVSKENEDRLNDILLKLYQMGYKTVMLNQTIEENTVNNDRKKKRKGEENKTVPNMVPDPINVCKLNEKFKGKLCILNRITFICSDPTKTHTLAQCPNLKKYHLYAIVPTKQDMLEFACSQLNVDLITIRPLISGLKMKRKLYRQAVARGLCFEIQYADLLNRKTRVATIHYSHLLHMYYKCMNVIISSGADNPNLIRNPYDIINLGSMLGLSEIKSKAAILNQCQLLLLRAERRISGKAVFTVEFTEDPVEEDNEDKY